MPRIVRLAAAVVFGSFVGVTLPSANIPTGATMLLTQAAPAGQPFHWQGPVAAGQAVEIKNVNGSIHAELATGNEVEVTADIVGPENDTAGVRVEVVPHEGGVTICAVYPTPAGNQPNECKPGEGGRVSTRNNSAKVNFTVRVPSGVRLQAKSVNGGIEADGLESEVEARTVNGSVAVRSRGIVRAQTVNGSIQATLGSADWDGTLAFETVNGSIEVALPADVHAQVHAETVNGQLESDFPVTMKGKFGPRQFDGTIGQGGRTLQLKTVNGRIGLRRAS